MGSKPTARAGLLSIATVIVVGCAPPPANGPTVESAAASLEAAERAFARSAEEGTIAEAFLAVLADDGIVFRPGPINGREQFAAGSPPDALLTWEPGVVETSSDGTLGFTTGPFRFAPDRSGSAEAEIAHGHYVSVWRRASGGPWRLIADIGVAHAPGPAVAGPTRETPGSPDPAGSLEELLAIERAERPGCRDRAASDLRVYRPDHPPAEGVAAACELLDATTAEGVAEPAGGEVAASGDLGYTYGALPGASRHAFLHIWRREAGGWRLLVDVALPWPAPPPS